MESCWASGLVSVRLDPILLLEKSSGIKLFWMGKVNGTNDLGCFLGQLDREGNARKVVNCSCVVVRDWGEESQERSILLNYFQTEQ